MPSLEFEGLEISLYRSKDDDKIVIDISTSELTQKDNHQAVCDCSHSTGICGAFTRGTGKLDVNGYWEFPCQHCGDIPNIRFYINEQKIDIGPDGSLIEEIED